jgi:hypothetical protein
VTAASALERRYRRLLGCYPAQHRRAHGEEMLGVLMTGARAGQRWPRLSEAIDLIWAALRIRLRPGQADQGWRDALAVVSVTLPVLAVMVRIAGVVVLLTRVHGDASAALPVFLAVLALPLVLAAIVLLRLRRTAVGVALVMLIGAAIVLATGLPADGYAVGFYGSVLVLEIVALLGSPGPRRGLELLTWKHWLALVVVAAAASLLPRAPGLSLVIMVAVMALAVTWLVLSLPLARRVLTLLAIPGYYYVIGIWVRPPVAAGAIAAVYLPPLAIAGLAAVAARRAARPATPG